MRKSTDFKKISVYRGPEESPGFLLWSVSTLWRRSIETVLKSIDLTHPQFVVLAATAWLTKTKDNVSQAEIGRFASLDPNTTSQILRGLQTKGLIERVRSKDERSKHPSLTNDGKARLEKAMPAVEKADEEFFSVLKSERREFIKNLQKLSKLTT